MYLKCHARFKDGKKHRNWSVVESVRTRRGVIKHLVLYLGEINDSRRAQWCSAIDAVDPSTHAVQSLSLFSEDRQPPQEVSNPVQIRLDPLTLRRALQWGGCWLALELWNQLDLDSFGEERLADSRKGTDWRNVLKTPVSYRLLDPGSERRLHRARFKTRAMGDLLDEDNSIAAKDTHIDASIGSARTRRICFRF